MAPSIPTHCCQHQFDLNAICAEAVRQGLQQLLGLAVEKTRAIHEINANDAQRFLLQGIFAIEHAYVNENLLVIAVGPVWNLIPIQP